MHAFDEATRNIQRASRRSLLAALAAAATVPAAGPTRAKRRKKGCQFAMQPGLWTLKKDCKLTKPLTVPEGVQLEGGGHTIGLSGAARSFGDAALVVGGAANVTLSVAGLRGVPITDFGVVRIRQGVLDGVRVVGLARENAIVAGPGDVSVLGCEIEALGDGPNLGMLASGPTLVDQTLVTGATTGIFVGGGNLTLVNSTVQGPGALGRNGVVFTQSASGNVSNSRIAGFADLGSGGCGISIDETASSSITVDLQTLEFADNGHDVCD